LYGVRGINKMEKPSAKGDRCYCNNTQCKKECWRKIGNWTFDYKNIVMYTFINKCDDYMEG